MQDEELPRRVDKPWGHELWFALADLKRPYLPGFVGLIPERYRRPGCWEQELCDLLGVVEAQTEFDRGA